MRESRVRDNFNKLFLLKVCLPTVYRKIGEKRIDALEKGWATEVDYTIVDDLVHPEIEETIDQIEVALAACNDFEEMIKMIKDYNHLLYLYIADSNVTNEKELYQTVKMYYTYIKEATRFGRKI